MKKTILSLLLVGIVVAGLVFLLKMKQSDAPDPIGQNTNQTESKYLVTKEPTMVSVAEDSYLLGIGGSYPQFSQADATFNTKIASMVSGEVAAFKKSANDDYQARLKTGGDAFLDEFAKGGMYTLTVKTDLVQSNDRSISFAIRIEGYTGGAHGYHTVTTFNYDVANHRELALTDFMPLTSASTVARDQLRKIFTDNGDAGTFDTFALDGTDPAKPENFKNFTFTNNAVIIYFNEYQVAPYVYGEMQVTVPIKK